MSISLGEKVMLENCEVSYEMVGEPPVAV